MCVYMYVYMCVYIYIYINIYIHTHRPNLCIYTYMIISFKLRLVLPGRDDVVGRDAAGGVDARPRLSEVLIQTMLDTDLEAYVKIHQRGVQWKQGVVTCMQLYTSLSYNTTPIHCTPLPLHPPVMNTDYNEGGPKNHYEQVSGDAAGGADDRPLAGRESVRGCIRGTTYTFRTLTFCH